MLIQIGNIPSFDFPLWLLLLICWFLLVYKYATQPGTIWKSLGVPSPSSVPFIGHMHRIYHPETGFRGSIHRWTKQYGKIFGILFFRHPMLVVLDIDAVKEVLVKDFSNFTNRFGGPPGLYQAIIQKSILLNGGQSWKRVRHIMSPNFGTGKLKLATRHINRNALNLVGALEDRVDRGIHPEAKVVFSAFSLDVLAGAAFGLELNSQKDLDGAFYQHAKGLVTFRKSLQLVIGTLGALPFLGGLFKMFDIGFFDSSHINYFKTQFNRLISERRKDKGVSTKNENSDFLNSLINGEHESSPEHGSNGDKRLTTEEIVAQSIIFVIAGYETTSATLQWLTFELSKREDVQNRIRKEIDDVIREDSDSDDFNVTYEQCQKLKYTEAVIHEALRMYPPVVTLSRMSKRATKLKGVSVPANAAVVIPVYNICRDPELFENPDNFIPERFLSDAGLDSNSNSNNRAKPSATSLLTSLPFGFGPRQCLGVSLAILQVKIALVHILRNFSIQGATPEHVEIDDFTALLIPKQPIRLILNKL